MKIQRYIKHVLALLALAATLALFGCSYGHVHAFTDGRTIWEPSCTKKGLMEQVCECGQKRSVELALLDHEGGEWQIVAHPDCVNEGKRQKVCVDCGVILEEETLPALGHELEYWEAKEPTCSQMGHNAFEICNVCDYSTYKSIPMLEHVPSGASTCTEAQFCTVCNIVLCEAMGHTPVTVKGIGANCVRAGKSDYVYCAVCSLTLVESIDLPITAHTPEEVDGYEPTCSETGLSDGLVCSFCDKVLVDQVELPTTDHRYSDSKDDTCNKCGAYRSIICTHKQTDRINRTVATCSSGGLSAGEVCKDCGFVTKKQTFVEPKEHTYKIIEGYAPTATTPGLSDGVYCTTCKTRVKSMVLIPPVASGDGKSYDGSYHEDYNGGKLEYVVNAGAKTCTIIGKGTCTSPYIVIPTEIDGYKVTAIGSYAFRTEYAICGVYISESVETIGDKAFSMCTSLTSVNMSDGTKLGELVFDGSTMVQISYRHTTFYVAAAKATCKENGVVEHFECKNCDGCFADTKGEEPLYQISTTSPHSFVADVCEDCGAERSKIRVMEISAPNSIPAVPVGTLADSIGLPSHATLKTSDFKTHSAPIKWDLSEYDSRYEGVYTISGYVQLGSFILGPSASSTLTLTVEVKEGASRIADVILLVDTTKSMAQKLDELTAGVEKLTKKLEAAGITARFSLIKFENSFILGSYTAKQINNGLSPWFEGGADYIAAVESLVADGNDKSESAAPIDAVVFATRLDTRKDAKKFVIILSDGYCTPTNGFGYNITNQLYNDLRRNKIYVGAVVAERYRGSYSSFLEDENSFYAGITAPLETTYGENVAEFIISNVCK